MKAENSETLNSINDSIALTPEQSDKLQAAVKIGLCKELHRKGLLTDMQLNYLILEQNE